MLRHYLTGTGREVVERSLTANPEALSPQVAGVLQTLREAERGPVSLLPIAKADVPFASPGYGAEATNGIELSTPAARAVVDALTSIDPDYGGAMRERLAAGGSVSDAAASVWERKRPLADVLNEQAGTARPSRARSKGRRARLRLGTNTWVQKDRSWTYGVTLRHLLEYQVAHGGKTLVDGPNDTAARLHTMSRPAHQHLDARARAD